LVKIATPPPLEDLSCQKMLQPERLTSVFKTLFLNLPGTSGTVASHLDNSQ
jgi:hypothetical protein